MFGETVKREREAAESHLTLMRRSLPCTAFLTAAHASS